LRGHRTLAGLLALVVALPLAASAEPRRESREDRLATARQRDAARVAAQTEALIRANPKYSPQNEQFYAGTPWVADWVREQCAQPPGYPRPSPQTCRAAASARQWDRR
jgi:hypothetical protein